MLDNAGEPGNTSIMRLEDSLRDGSDSRFLVAGDLVLDSIDRRAWLASSPLALGTKAFALLEELMRSPQLLVTKERLFEVAWPDQAVSDAVLTTAIREVRRALDDPARSPRWIETHHGKGYRFLAHVDARSVHPGRKDVSCETSEKTADHAPQIAPRLRIGLALLLAALAGGALYWLFARGQADVAPASAPAAIEEKTVVALPFKAIGSDAEALADGLDEEIATTLARTPDIQLAGAGVKRQVEEAGADADRIGREAGFGHILSGSVRVEGSGVRVTARLTDTTSGREIWSERFDKPAQDIISLQEDVAFAIARALDSVMDPQRLRDMTRIGTRSVEAYRAWRKGRELVERAVTNSDPALMDEARASYARAQEIDPRFARAHWEAAYMELMTANTIYADTSDPAADARRRARYIGHIEAAIEAAPTETDRLLYRAAREVADFNYRESVRLLQRYLAERPRDADIWYSLLEQARIAERYDLVDEAIGQAIALGRQAGGYPVIGSNYMDHKPAMALRYAREAMAEAPDYTALQFQAHRAFLIAGQKDEARKLLARMTAGRLPVPVRDGARIRQLCADGRTREAQELARRLLADEDLPLVVRWSSALTAGLDREAHKVLAPLRGRDAMFTLAQFLIYREFDVRRFPQLTAALARAGIERPAAKKPVYACRTSG